MNTNTARVETTLSLLMSVDGKITSGESDNLDSDRDWKRIQGVKEGLQQYYHYESIIAANSLNTGRVMAKIGINSRREKPKKDERLTFFIVDRKPHLNQNGVKYLAQWIGKLFIVTDNPGHPAFDLRSDYKNIQVIYYKEKVDLPDLFVHIRQEYGIEHMVIESGGTLNSVLVRQRLIDHVCIIVAPVLVGGRATSTLMDGYSLRMEEELVNLKALKLVKCSVLEHSYLRLSMTRSTKLPSIPISNEENKINSGWIYTGRYHVEGPYQYIFPIVLAFPGFNSFLELSIPRRTK